MKWLILFLIIPFSVQLDAQQIIIKHHAYTSYWNTQTKIPDSVVYDVNPHKKVCGRESGFHADGQVPNFNTDYAHSGYDIGHECNASDENGNKQDEFDSFSYSNVFPQLPHLNRLTWLALENYVRQLNKPAHIVITWRGIKGHIGKDNITVPLYCDKKISYQGTTERYSMPNQDTVSNHPFAYYKIKN